MRGQGSNLPRHHFSSKLMMALSSEPPRRSHFVLKDAQLLESPGSRRPDGQVLWGEMLIRVRQSGCGANCLGGSRPFPPTHRLQPRSCVSPLGLGPAQCQGGVPVPALPCLATSHWLPLCFLVSKHPLFPPPPTSQPHHKELICWAPDARHLFLSFFP